MADGENVCSSCGHEISGNGAVVGEVVDVISVEETNNVQSVEEYQVGGVTRRVAMTEDQRKSLATDIMIWSILALLSSLFLPIL